MCGIVGFTGDGASELLQRMTRQLVHRGPDGKGFYQGERIAFGMRRLAIVDVKTGFQPISSEDDNIQVVSNGEIYNHLELRKKLVADGHVFRTDHSDTETIVHLYEQFGFDWPLHVNGMFATAIWERQTRQLLLFRDRIGKKPLYYAHINGQIIFASEIKAILCHPKLSQRLDGRSLYDFLSLKNTCAPRTIYKNIRMLPPGCFLKWQSGKIQIKRYWKPDFSRPITGITAKEAADRLYRMFEDAVRLRMRCDAPYGAYLSGGVDSSAVVAMMARYLDRPVKTFTLGYRDKPKGQFWGKGQDRKYASRMARRLGTEHYEYILSAKEFAERMPEIVTSFDEPFSGAVSTFFISAHMKKYVKATLSGDGADELFGSYLAHRVAFPIQKYFRLCSLGKVNWQDLIEREKKGLAPFDSREGFRFLSTIADEKVLKWRGRLAVFTPSEIKCLLRREIWSTIEHLLPENPYQEIAENFTAHDVLNQSLEIDQKELLPSQVLTFMDRLSMAHSIEIRSPWLDYRIIEFANRLPGTLKIHDGVVKSIQKKALRHLLPAEILNRQKEGFVQPVYSWMHGSLKQWSLEKLAQLPHHVFNHNYLQRFRNALEVADHSSDAKIWSLICLSLWCEKQQELEF